MRTALGHKEIVVITLFISILEQNPSEAARSRSPKSTTTLDGSASHSRIMHQKNLICNNGTIHRCLCSSNGNSHAAHNSPPCDQLIQDHDLDAITIEWPRRSIYNRHGNNETYENFFKRQIAVTVSKYCEQQANKCRGAWLRVEEGNIVILQIEPTGSRHMNITFVIAKNSRVYEIATKTVMNSTRIRALLVQKKRALSEALEGVPISNHKISVKRLKHREEDNTRLLTLVGLIGFFFTVTYAIAAVKVCRDHYYKMRAKRRAINRAVIENNIPDYGSCEPTTNMKTPNVNENRIHRRHSNSPEALDLSVRIAEPSPSPVDERSIQRMFECDPSQLPAEQPLWSENSSLDQPAPSTSYEANPLYKDNPGPKARIQANKEKKIKAKENEVKETINNDKEKLLPLVANHNNTKAKIFGSTEKFLSRLIAEPQVARSRTAHEIGTWSSDSEDEHNDVYYRLSEAEEDNEEEPDDNVKRKGGSDSESGEQNGKLERDSSCEINHVYQRLEESPASIPNNSGPAFA